MAEDRAAWRDASQQAEADRLFALADQLAEPERCAEQAGQLAAAQEADAQHAEPYLPRSRGEEVAELREAGWYDHVDPEPWGAEFRQADVGGYRGPGAFPELGTGELDYLTEVADLPWGALPPEPERQAEAG
jgi:hypothetical protein